MVFAVDFAWNYRNLHIDRVPSEPVLNALRSSMLWQTKVHGLHTAV